MRNLSVAFASIHLPSLSASKCRLACHWHIMTCTLLLKDTQMWQDAVEGIYFELGI